MADDLVTAPATRQVLGGVSAMFLWRRLRDDPSFPRPIRYVENGPRFWRRAELERWIEAHREDRPEPDSADEAATVGWRESDAPLEGNPAAHEQVAGTATRQALCTGDAAKANRKRRGDRGSGDSDNAP